MWCIIAFDVVFRQTYTPEIEVGNCAKESTCAQKAHRDKSKRMSQLIGTEDKDLLNRGTLPDQQRRRTTLNGAFNNEATHTRLSVHGMAEANNTPDTHTEEPHVDGRKASRTHTEKRVTFQMPNTASQYANYPLPDGGDAAETHLKECASAPYQPMSPPVDQHSDVVHNASVSLHTSDTISPIADPHSTATNPGYGRTSKFGGHEYREHDNNVPPVCNSSMQPARDDCARVAADTSGVQMRRKKNVGCGQDEEEEVFVTKPPMESYVPYSNLYSDVLHEFPENLYDDTLAAPAADVTPLPSCTDEVWV